MQAIQTGQPVEGIREIPDAVASVPVRPPVDVVQVTELRLTGLPRISVQQVRGHPQENLGRNRKRLGGNGKHELPSRLRLWLLM
jgi:hypothetical protein